MKLRINTVCVVIACFAAMLLGILSTIIFINCFSCECKRDSHLSKIPVRHRIDFNAPKEFLLRELSALQNMIHLQSLSFHNHLAESDIPFVTEWNYTAAPVTTSVNLNSSFVNTDAWKAKVTQKLFCRSKRAFSVSYYLYHSRKAAGTTIREILKYSGLTNRVLTFETEGVTLNRGLLNMKDLLTVTSFRHPIDRIISLYWYEHVAWYVNVLKKPAQCKTLEVWVNGWRDISAHKLALLTQYPSNNYVEIENYYVKMLIGWKVSDGPLTREHLTVAKQVLSHFDVILIMEWLHEPWHLHYLEYLLPLTGPFRVPNSFKKHTFQTILSAKMVKGDGRLQDQYNMTYAPNEVSPTLFSSILLTKLLNNHIQL